MFRNSDGRRHSGAGQGRGSGMGYGRGRGSGMGSQKDDRTQYTGTGRGRDSGAGYERQGNDGAFFNDPRQMDYPVYADPANSTSDPSDIGALKQRAEILEEQLNTILQRIHDLGKEPSAERSRGTVETTPMKAVVHENICTGCGICAGVCPVRAIHMNDIAHIDAALCTGCGNCVQSCRPRAIDLIPREQV